MAESRRSVDVAVLTGDPKKAIRMMFIPMTVALLVQTINNVVDTVWVTGLGPDALAALGVTFPIFFILIAVGSGLGVGSSQAIARRIGAKDSAGADKAAVQGLAMIFVSGIAMTVTMSLVAPTLMGMIGGEGIETECLAYAMPIIIGSTILFLSSYFSSLLRSEGSAKRSMNIQILGAGVNIVLDPIFIFTFGWGIAGAAIATVVAMTIPVIISLYWFKIKKDTYLKLSFKGFRFDPVIIKDILKVGIPAFMEMVLVAVISMFMNIIIFGVGGTYAIAIYTSGWRIIEILMIPLMGISWAIVPVCAANYGADNYDGLKTAFYYSIKMMVVVMTAMTIVSYVFADTLCILFSYSESTEVLRSDMADMLRVMVLFLPFVAVGFIGSGFFQSLGLGMKSLVSTVIRNVMQIPICLYLATFGILSYLWWGIMVSEVVGSLIMGLWSMLILRELLKTRAVAKGRRV